MSAKEDLVNTVISGKYIIKKYIGSGSFGDVYEALNKKTNSLVALKIPVITKERNGQKMLMDEAKIYKYISNPSKGIANVKVTKHKEYKIIVMDLLGPNMEALFSKANKKFSLQTIIRLAIMMIDILQYIHSNGFIHRDLKPDNFVINNKKITNKNTIDYDSDLSFYGKESPTLSNTKLYCIDFGLAKKYLKKDGTHIDYCDNKKFCGTAKFASIAAHEHIEQSRKDDLEAIAYILVYLYKGRLPWQGIKTKDKKKRYNLIYKEKMKYSPEELCKDMPREFIVFLNYVRTLSFDEKPPYNSFKKMFSRLYEHMEYKEHLFEWEK